MIGYKEIDQAVVDKVGSRDGLLTFELKAVGDDAIFSVSAKRGDGSYTPPVRMYAARNTEGKVVIKPIPEWLAAYL